MNKKENDPGRDPWRKHGPRCWSKRHKHGSPTWWDPSRWEEWKKQGHRPPRPPWGGKRPGGPRRHHDERALFARLALVFGLLVVLGCGIVAVLAFMGAFFLLARPGTHSGPPPLAVAHPMRWLVLLVGVVIILAVALRWLVRMTTRRYTGPLSETMQAADALAEGDLSARVPERGGSEFRHFIRSFNRMAEALDVSDRQRRELLADIAHELRTPLTVIQGNLEGLRDGVYEATSEQLDLVLDETHKLSRLVEDLRLLTLAEAGKLPLDLQVLDVGQLLADVGEAFDCQASEASIDLIVEVAEPLPPLVADPLRLGQVLGNLMTNALRHTPPGGAITLGAELPPGNGSSRVMRLWITDTGEGIAAEALPHIFDRFWRGDPARSHEAGAGSGLGLAIAKSLVETQGGRIWAESQPGRGTTVSCVLPLSSAGTNQGFTTEPPRAQRG